MCSTGSSCQQNTHQSSALLALCESQMDSPHKGPVVHFSYMLPRTSCWTTSQVELHLQPIKIVFSCRHDNPPGYGSNCHWCIVGSNLVSFHKKSIFNLHPTGMTPSAMAMYVVSTIKSMKYLTLKVTATSRVPFIITGKILSNCIRRYHSHNDILYHYITNTTTTTLQMPFSNTF